MDVSPWLEDVLRVLGIHFRHADPRANSPELPRLRSSAVAWHAAHYCCRRIFGPLQHGPG